ncbi:HNH endonuclease [Williamsia sp. Leaf354]|uniref:HNH endonuclease n=1 Tax=Williamsia sp. Leaf354 TaxID=1736349 RepID=UPI00070094F4|nr:HNH endonuclease signature motif containing protein [Williamsia sp. Leaf354]KQR99471.1 HNH endonuclease [Williamsia sp. Leaf354]
MTVTAIASKQSDLFDQSSPGGLSDAALTERVVGYAGQIASLTARFLDLLVEFDKRGVWSGEGVRSCAHWLSWRTGLSLRAAQEHLRIAHALHELPQMHAAFAQGRLSYSKVRALTRVATTDREEELVNVALSATAAQVERIVRSVSHIDRRENEADTGRVESSARWQWNDDGTLAVTMRLSPLDGARFLAGVVRSEYESTRTAGDPDLPLPETAPNAPRSAAGSADLWRHVPSNIADAVVAMADTMATVTAMPTYAPGAEIVIHTDADDAGAEPHLDSGPAISETDVDEASCGGSRRTVTHRRGRKDVVLRWGRKRRLPTHTLLRLVSDRDRGCRHPACGRTRHLHAHHVRFWRDGGSTDPDNLIMLCSTHHRALHNGEFTIRAVGDQQFTFHTPSGTAIDTAPTITAPDSWRPDSMIAADAIEPVGGGALDLGYTLEVLYAAWEWRTGQHTTPIAA